MRYLKVFLAIAVVLAFAGIVKAEISASSYDAVNLTQQVDTIIYPTGAIKKNDVVVLDVSTGTVGNKGLGSYAYTTTTSDSIYVIGVADEEMTTGVLGRVCIRGPHKVNWITTQTSVATALGAGGIVAASSTAGAAAPYSTADGTAGGRLGYLLSATASTDSGDTANKVYWIEVAPTIHK